MRYWWGYKLTTDEVAKKFGYSSHTLYSLIRDLRAGKADFFPQKKNKGPAKRQTPDYIQSLIKELREKKLSCADIAEHICSEGYKISEKTVELIIRELNLPRLIRRSKSQRGLTKNNENLSSKANPIAIDKLKPFMIDCPIAGVFFLLPYVIESGVIEIVKACHLPESSAINSTQACLSMLLLKLIGSERLSHIKDYNHESALGLFAGLTVLPKSTYMTTYSCRTSEEMLFNLQSEIMQRFKKVYPDFYQSDFINLDFHSIPHFGSESEMEKVWCGARGKAMKGANTLLAQDSNSNTIIYTNADVLRKDEPKAIQDFIAYWKKISGDLTETLVFDCKLTSYRVLDEISKDNVKFITLRKRNKKLLQETLLIDDNKWKTLRINIPKRKHKSCSVYDGLVTLPKCDTEFRQIIIKDHGRAEPTFVITNDHQIPLKEALVVYAKRWHIENKIAEMVSFFNLNALSSPLMIRIHFDMLWTVVADTIYHRFAQNLPRFENNRADTIFRKFIDMPGKIVFDGSQFILKIRKRATTPILLGVKNLNNKIPIPWLEDKKLSIEWTA